ncbi:MAG: riboflavin synthase [Paracoccaceae bacterium]
MFTGIITDIGQIERVELRGDIRARLKTSYDHETIVLGASIACNGVCLTVVDFGVGWFDVDISAETVSKTNIGPADTAAKSRSAWVEGGRVNLERALKLGDELGGHIVSGHVDGIAEITAITEEGDSTRVEFKVAKDLARFIAPKGSVALNGTSLTVNEVGDESFGVNFIPHTKTVTTWGDMAVGDLVNLEIDTLARYVARLADTR